MDLHPTEPWMLASLYNGSVCVWNHETQVITLTFLYYDFFKTDQYINSNFQHQIYKKNLKMLLLVDYALRDLYTRVTVKIGKYYLEHSSNDTSFLTHLVSRIQK